MEHIKAAVFVHVDVFQAAAHTRLFDAKEYVLDIPVAQNRLLERRTNSIPYSQRLVSKSRATRAQPTANADNSKSEDEADGQYGTHTPRPVLIFSKWVYNVYVTISGRRV